ncbi:flagellar basal body rod protein FlgB [Achromobacter insolitus]|jgi:flagellar basal-body rod protein FlgB|uniref:Flagellar basal body rod protein FlgB n=1 Tax=Achromobacter insolitus TaxID=217204 RepID=A0A6S7F0Q6_9BURK|nr:MULTISPECIES: flagellar basal body rod protein FlgB [Achromobacter]GLK93994.1 flagellar basal body rod protein FlgB [Achromobacter xylosoxidans]APX74110.1 flagellar basal body rod protein FlgB [Achromobacter insolitus]AVG38957.1 flagellar basal body rod protein FlgB [Achromobacter insolitus]AXA69640.1 flagellar basal body rod protein FlgB [Achromobacter insolitus]MCP1403768.1 flagellar basal-body rod protein FlgB [Achromobacter insolitus]
MLDRLNEDFRFFQQSLGLRAQRQEVLSSNIANADTPNYKARDFDFKTAMATAMEGSKRLPDTSLTLTSTRHIPAKAVSQGPTELLYRLPYQPSLDGNTVDMDIERVQFADNTLHYQSTMQMLSGRIRTMMAAIQD